MTNTKISLRVTRHFDFSAQQVFDAWLAPEKAGKFLLLNTQRCRAEG
jgi:uncharacterized protein YndB with AHSA1/START domain